MHWKLYIYKSESSVLQSGLFYSKMKMAYVHFVSEYHCNVNLISESSSGVSTEVASGKVCI